MPVAECPPCRDAGLACAGGDRPEASGSTAIPATSRAISRRWSAMRARSGPWRHERVVGRRTTHGAGACAARARRRRAKAPLPEASGPGCRPAGRWRICDAAVGPRTPWVRRSNRARTAGRRRRVLRARSGAGGSTLPAGGRRRGVSHRHRAVRARPPVAADPPLALEPGRHGLVVESNGRRGLLLPQVATEWGWTRDEFLRQTCLKAGLAPDAWRQGAQLFTFEAEIFGELDS